MSSLDELIHLSAQQITEIHDGLLEDSAGLKGARSDLSVDALIGRIHSSLVYGLFYSIEEVAALYAEVIAKGHVFNDGNKRTALVSMLTFLDLNGYSLVADQEAIADKMVDISEGKLGYIQFSLWLKPKIFAS